MVFVVVVFTNYFNDLNEHIMIYFQLYSFQNVGLWRDRLNSSLNAVSSYEIMMNYAILNE